MRHPWEVLDLGFTDSFFRDEWRDAFQELETEPCTESKCHACGVCFRLDTKNLVTHNRSDNNPYVTEIDIEKRKASCASLDIPDLTSLEFTQTRQTETDQRHKGPPTITSIKSQAEKLLEAPKTTKLRCRISKLGDLRFIGHLDFQRLVEAAFRRSGLRFVHTEGFNQRLKISWGPALGLFIESEWEYIDIELAETAENLENLKNILNRELPKEAKILAVEEIQDKSSINKVLELSYKARLLSPATLDTEGLLKDKNLVLDMKFLSTSEIFLRLPAKTKVADVLNAISPGSKWRICKTEQVLEQTTQVLVHS